MTRGEPSGPSALFPLPVPPDEGGSRIEAPDPKHPCDLIDRGTRSQGARSTPGNEGVRANIRFAPEAGPFEGDADGVVRARPRACAVLQVRGQERDVGSLAPQLRQTPPDLNAAPLRQFARPRGCLGASGDEDASPVDVDVVNADEGKLRAAGARLGKRPGSWLACRPQAPTSHATSELDLVVGQRSKG